jgi:hypothetical protein
MKANFLKKNGKHGHLEILFVFITLFFPCVGILKNAAYTIIMNTKERFQEFCHTFG